MSQQPSTVLEKRDYTRGIGTAGKGRNGNSFPISWQEDGFLTLCVLFTHKLTSVHSLYFTFAKNIHQPASSMKGRMYSKLVLGSPD